MYHVNSCHKAFMQNVYNIYYYYYIYNIKIKKYFFKIKTWSFTKWF